MVWLLYNFYKCEKKLQQIADDHNDDECFLPIIDIIC